MNGPLDLHPKTTGAGLSAAFALIILYSIHWWVVPPPEVAAAGTAILAFAGAWLAPLLKVPQPQ